MMSRVKKKKMNKLGDEPKHKILASAFFRRSQSRGRTRSSSPGQVQTHLKPPLEADCYWHTSISNIRGRAKLLLSGAFC